MLGTTRNIFLYSVLLFSSQLILSCSSIEKVGARQQPAIDIVVREPNRIRFSGKGAGAGVMLSSSMGPMGIAIDIAIDEGISKDIQSAAVEANFDIENAIREATMRSVVDANQTLGTRKKCGVNAQSGRRDEISTIEVTLEKYGFILSPTPKDKTDDYVAPLIEGSITLDGRLFTFDKTQTATQNMAVIKLSEAKKDGALVASALTGRLQNLISSVMRDYVTESFDCTA